MDIQEKKAFEIAFDKKLGARGCQFDLDEDGNYEDRETLCGWHMWLEVKAQAVPEGFVLVPKECPDPIFADKLFDHLCEKAHGEFGDDQMIFFSDIDESAIWQLMIDEASQ